MALAVLLLLLLSSIAGLGAGRWKVVVAAAIAVLPCALVGGPETAALAVLAVAGLAAGVHLHRVVADHTPPPRAS